MPTLVMYLNSNRPSTQFQRGFSLIELLVVLLLLGLVSAVAYPRLESLLQAQQRKSLEKDAQAAILAIAEEARLYARPQVIVSSGELQISDPLAENQIRIINPISINALGLCLEGKVEITAGSVSLLKHVHPPFCVLTDG